MLEIKAVEWSRRRHDVMVIVVRASRTIMKSVVG
jgi:hypothetical protein